MTLHERKDRRTCGNCVHKYVCRFRKEEKDPDTCVNHIYKASPKRCGDLQELIDPVCEWIKNHYPSDGKLIVDRYSATFEIPVHKVYSEEIRNAKQQEDR